MAVIETPVAIRGARGTRIGVAMEGARSADQALLILAAPGETRTGPGRLYVRLARELVSRGLPSMRLDAPDGGDCAPCATNLRMDFDDHAVTAARHLLALYPDARIAILAVGSGAAGAARAWSAVARADLPLSALCLVDPLVGMAVATEKPDWWHRLHALSASEAGQAATPGFGEDEHAGSAELWHKLPTIVREAHAKLLVVARGSAVSSGPLVELAFGNRSWRKALRRSHGWLELARADPGFIRSADWLALTDWLATRLTR